MNYYVVYSEGVTSDFFVVEAFTKRWQAIAYEYELEQKDLYVWKVGDKERAAAIRAYRNGFTPSNNRRPIVCEGKNF